MEVDKQTLIHIISKFPWNSTFKGNRLGNLSVKIDDEYVGFIDMETGEVNTDYELPERDESETDLTMSDLSEMAPGEHKNDWPLTVRVFAGRKRIMLGGAFSSYLSEPIIPVENLEEIVKIFNEEYHRIKNEQKGS